MKEFTVKEESDLVKVAKVVLEMIEEQPDRSGATVLALQGDLGSGKTTFTKELARQLGVSATVTSPTFVVMKFHSTASERWKRLAHIDAYRIEDEDEMRPLHFSEVLVDPHTIVCIEWAEKIAALLPPHIITIQFEIVGDTRTITIT